MKKYIVKKDLPGIKAGTVIEPCGYGMPVTQRQAQCSSWPYYYSEGGSMLKAFVPVFYLNNTEWFEEFKEGSKVKEVKNSIGTDYYAQDGTRLCPMSSYERLFDLHQRLYNDYADLMLKEKGIGVDSFVIRVGKGGMFTGPASLADHPMCKKEEPAKTGLAIDVSKGTIDEAKKLGKLWEKFQPTVLPIRQMKHFGPGEFIEHINLHSQDGKKLSVDEIMKEFFKQPLQFSSEMPTIGNGWIILSFEMKKSGSSMEALEGIYTRKPDGAFHKGTIAMPGRWFIVNNAEIHSVERLRDHSIFTVGEITNYGTIERIIKSWVGIEIHFTNGNGATLESLEKVSDVRVKNMTAHNLSPEGTTIKAIVRGDVTDTDLKKINQAIEGILSKKKK